MMVPCTTSCTNTVPYCGEGSRQVPSLLYLAPRQRSTYDVQSVWLIWHRSTYDTRDPSRHNQPSDSPRELVENLIPNPVFLRKRNVKEITPETGSMLRDVLCSLQKWCYVSAGNKTTYDVDIYLEEHQTNMQHSSSTSAIFLSRLEQVWYIHPNGGNRSGQRKGVL